MERDTTLENSQAGLPAEEKLASLFQPDKLPSAQYFDSLRRKALLEPEKRLMLAVLQDAIHCFQDNLAAETVVKKKLLADAEEWIRERDGDWVFSFAYICEALGFRPEYLRRGLLRSKEKQRSQGMEDEAWERKKKA